MKSGFFLWAKISQIVTYYIHAYLKSYCKTKSVRKELACKPNGGWQ
jgi:hypothetical protein